MKKVIIILLVLLVVGCSSKTEEKKDINYKNFKVGDCNLSLKEISDNNIENASWDNDKLILNGNIKMVDNMEIKINFKSEDNKLKVKKFYLDGKVIDSKKNSDLEDYLCNSKKDKNELKDLELAIKSAAYQALKNSLDKDYYKEYKELKMDNDKFTQEIVKELLKIKYFKDNKFKVDILGFNETPPKASIGIIMSEKNYYFVIDASDFNLEMFLINEAKND